LSNKSFDIDCFWVDDDDGKVDCEARDVNFLHSPALTSFLFDKNLLVL
jgi:hypothetical protein